MKLTIPIEELHPGMFVIADVLSILVDAEIRHFLDFREAAFDEPGSGRIRLMKRKYRSVANSGGMLVKSAKQVSSLIEVGLSTVTIDTDKSDVVPDVAELQEEHSARQALGADEDADELAVSSLDDPDAEEGKKETRRAVPSVEVGATGRRNFGPSGMGWMKVESDHARGEAVMTVISFGGDDGLRASDVRDVLEEGYGITSGIDEEMVQRLAEQALSSPNRVIRGHFPVASSLPADRAAPGRLEYTFMDDVPEEPPLAHGDLRQAIEQQSLPQVMFKPIPARVVMPGEELAVFMSESSEASVDDRRAEAESHLKAGANVDMADNRYVSQIYGYVCLIANEISIIPPIWVTPDNMEAYFIKMPFVGPPAALTSDWFAALLEIVEVRRGVIEDGLEKVAKLPADGFESVLVAKGSPVGSGEAGKIYLAFKRPSPGVAALAADGATSHELDSSLVEEGALLAEVTHATEETAGHDLAGNLLDAQAQAIEEVSLTAGLNVRSETKGKREYFYAEKAGRAREKDGNLRVHEVTYIDEDIEGVLEIEKERDVVVRGSIRAGAEIVAGGSLHVEGMVERGAKVRTQDDVVVGKGIIGHETSVVAMGDVESNFVQSATVVARGDVTIGGYALNAKVRAGGHLIIEAEDDNERSGSGIGGELAATRGIEAGRIGSGATPTKLIIGPDPDLAARIRQADEGFEVCRTNMLRIFRTLGINDIDATHFKRLIEESPPNKRKAVVATLNQLRAIVDKRSQLQKHKRELEAIQAESLEGAEIVVRDELASDVEVRFGKVSATYTDKLPGTIFSLAGDSILQRGR